MTDRFPILIKGEDNAGEFYRKNFGAMFAYVSKRIPEITDELYKIDDAMKAGFGWENGPFEIWDAVGVKKGIELIKDLGKEPAAWVNEMLESGVDSFYDVREGDTYYYSIPDKIHKKIPPYTVITILVSGKSKGSILDWLTMLPENTTDLLSGDQTEWE